MVSSHTYPNEKLPSVYAQRTYFSMKFSELFTLLPNGNVSPIRPIKIGNFFMGAGSSTSRNITMNGVNLVAAWDKEITFKEVDGVIVIAVVTG